MTDIQTAELLEEVKQYLDITWIDSELDKKINNIIARGIIFLDKKSGTALDYAANGRGKELLLEYCRFSRDGVLGEFMASYAPMLKDLIEDGGGAYGV